MKISGGDNQQTHAGRDVTFYGPPEDPCSHYHRLLVTKLNIIAAVGGATLTISIMLNLFLVYNLNQHVNRSQGAHSYLNEHYISVAELIHDAVTQILVSINNAELTNADKAFIRSVAAGIGTTTREQTTHWHQYFSGRDRLAEERRVQNKEFMKRTDDILSAMYKRLSFLEAELLSNIN